MRFPNSFLDDIRNRLRISEVVGARVQFDRKKTNAAKGDFWGCCPFHGEKTPSFHCEDSKGRYHCFGCGVSGDHFRFLTELEGVSFPEAVERLADQAGLPMPVFDKREIEREAKRADLYDVMEMATQFFRDQLQTAAGAKARAYLRDRGLSVAVQQKFGLGYSPNSRNALKEFLASKDITPKQMEDCGLVVHGEGIAVSYDRFRDRIMFPIPDARGRTIAFGGRALSADVMAKYLNSPETELFHKSNVLYNFAKARKPAHEQGQVIAVEGYMDVIALDAAGIENAVAPLGTALTERQMQLLWRIHSEPILCFDGDGAGLKAAHRAVDMSMPMLVPGKSVRFALLPDGMDPDDVVNQSGAQAMRDILDSAVGLADTLWNRELHAHPHDTPEKRAELEQRVKQAVGQVRDENVRRYYFQDMESRMKGQFQPQRGGAQAGNRGANSGKRPYNSDGYQRGGNGGNTRGNAGYGNGSGARGNAGASSRATGRINASPSLMNSSLVKKNGQTGSNRASMREAVLVMGVVFHPAISVIFFEEYANLVVSHAQLRNLHARTVALFAEYGGDQETLSREELATALKESGLEEIMAGFEQQLRATRVWQSLPDAAFEDAVDGWKQAYVLHLRNRTLHSELKAAEHALAHDDSEENLNRLLQIRNELENEEGTEALIDGFGISSGRASGGF